MQKAAEKNPAPPNSDVATNGGSGAQGRPREHARRARRGRRKGPLGQPARSRREKTAKKETMHAIAAEAVNGKETPDTDKVTTEELGKALATSKAMSRSRMLAASRVVPGMLKAGILLDGIVVPMAAVLIWILPKVGESDWLARNVLVYLLFCFTVPLLFGIATPLYIMGFREYDRRRGRHRPAMWAFQCIFQTVAIPVLALVLGFVPLGASVSTLSDKIVSAVPPAISRLLHAPQDEADRAPPSYESAADPLVRKPPAPGPAAAPRVPTRKPPTRPPAPTPSASTKDAKFLTKRRFESTWRGITSNKAVVSVTLADLKRAFKDNSRAASAQYKGIPIVVRAYVGRRRLGEGGAPAVFLHRSRSADADPQVCEFPPRLATHVAKLRAGQEIIVWGALKERFFIPFIDSTAFAAATGRR